MGEIYEGTVKTITAFGAFVEFLPGTDGLLHVTEIAYRHIDNVEDVLKVGDKIKVKLIEIDEKTGKFRLSHKVLLPKPDGYTEAESRPRGPRGPRNGGGNGERRNGERRNDNRPKGGNNERRDRGPRNNNNNERRHEPRPHNNDERPAEPQANDLPDFPEL